MNQTMNNEETSSNLMLTIPQVQQAIFRDGGLTPQDLSCATLVCRAWFAIVTPYFWENVVITKKCYDMTRGDRGIEFVFKDGVRSGISKYGYWIRRLKTVDADVLRWLVESDHGGSRLLEIDFRAFGAYPNSDTAVQHLQLKMATTLTSNAIKLKKWKCFGVAEKGKLNFSELAPGLMNLKPGYLKDLQIELSNVGNELTLVLNQHQEHLQSVHLFGCLLSDNVFTGLLTPLIYLKTLIFASNRASNVLIEFQDGLQTLLEGAPNLVELKLVLHSLFWIETLQTALDRGCLRFLKDLTLDNYSYYTQSDAVNEEVLTRLLKSVPKSVTRLRLCRFYPLGIEGNNTLLDLAVGNRLTSFKVQGNCGMESKSWQKILATCRFLVEIGTEWIHTDNWLNVEDMTEPWICLDLELFALNIKPESGPIGELAGEEVLNRCRKFFLQLAALPKLKKLQMKLQTPTPNNWDRQNRRENVEMERAFLEKWSVLGACTQMEHLRVEISLWMMKLEYTVLEQACAKLWGSQVETEFSTSYSY